MENKPVTERRTAPTMNYNRVENIMGTTGKLTPQAVEFEEVVLGAVMIDGEAISTVLDILEPKMFYVEAHQHIFAAFKELFGLAQPIDLLTVTNQLRKKKLLDVVGGASYLAALTNRVTSSANIEYHARIIMEKFVVRELIHSCNEIITDAYDESKDVLDLMDNAGSKIFSIVESNFKRDSKELHQVVKTTLEELEFMMQNKDGLQGVPCGLRAIDEKTGGFQRSDLVIVAGRPGMGKTSFVLTIARNAAIDYDQPIALFSLEMSAGQLVQRLFAMESGVDAEHIIKGALSDQEWTKLSNSIGKLQTSNLIIDDTPALTVFDLRAKCRRLKHKHNIKMVIIDYLQLMQAGGDNSKSSKNSQSGNREQEISFISRSLKALAKELDIPVIALAQLSRAVETRGGTKRPMLSDLRESGSIEQDADMVLFIYRPEYYKLDKFEDESPSENKAEIMFEKNRHGSTGNVRVGFQKQYTKFTDESEAFTMNMDDTFSDNGGGIAPNQQFEVLGSKANDESTSLPEMNLPNSTEALLSGGFPDGDMPY